MAVRHQPRSRTRQPFDRSDLLAVSERSVQSWTKDARKAEKEAQQDKAFDLWLDCQSENEISEAVNVPRTTVQSWLDEKRKSADFVNPPAPRQHFDVWQFATADKDSGQQSYFGAVPP